MPFLQYLSFLNQPKVWLTFTFIILATIIPSLWKKKWSPMDQHCYVTGGSTGLGLSLAIILVQAGAHVSIVARDQTKLQKALEQLEAARVSSGQILKSYSYSLSSAEGSAAALEAASAAHGGRAPDALFLCAGASKPGFFVEMTEDDLTKGMVDGYWVQAWTALAATKKMVKDGVKGRIVFISSVLGLMSFVGWASYSPAKHALRGLADTLRSELLLYGINVHIFFPNTMYTPGYEEETKTKPAITAKIEEGDEGVTPEVAARGLLKGLQRGQTHIANDILADLFRASTRGSAPYNSVLLDGILGFVAWIGVPIWRRSVDSQVVAHRGEHAAYLAGK